MRKPSGKQRQRIVNHNLNLRRHSRKLRRGSNGGINNSSENADEGSDSFMTWLKTKINDGYQFQIDRSNTRSAKVNITLPCNMNFSDDYEETTVYVTAIRKLAEVSTNSITKIYGFVNFDNLSQISTSAALVLTAEISKWDDAVRNKVHPRTEKWNEEIFKRFNDLGFFDLFSNHNIKQGTTATTETKDVNLVKYIKRDTGDAGVTELLKKTMTEIVGENIDKWTFLYNGLSEAITNVTHHAYPDKDHEESTDKNWYLTGSFTRSSKQLKIVFYDQGIGIPNSLPASKIWERVLDLASKISNSSLSPRRDEVLLKAAVELERTSTGDSDRGKGLPDLLEFVKQRNDGYLSILSQKGLYKYSLHNGKSKIKTERFSNPILGTLIIWCVKL